MPDRYDFLIVGAGFAGLVLAERLSSQLGMRCLVVDRRSHIGGNAHDYYDDAGVLVHTYGPHYFRTNAPRVVDYLSQFTEWHQVTYKVRSFTRGRFWSFPINLTTFEQLIGRPASEEEFAAYLAEKRVPIENPRNSEEVVVSQVGWELYEMFFLGYTQKHWKMHPRNLAPSVCARIPIRMTRNDAYLEERFQALPRDGYYRLFENMVAQAQPLTIRLDTDYRDVVPHVRFDHMIYTGPVDAFFDHAFGRLPYRSLRFEFESFEASALEARKPVSGKSGFWQPEMQVNYPNDHAFTRIVEIKHATGQATPASTIVREFPASTDETQEPYYPVPTEASAAMYAKYAQLAESETNVSFVGRLATYRYYNMDQVVAMALKEFERLKARVERSAR
jgi:UDP-galactopyranose mutase